MSKVITHLATILVGAAIGYITYPIVNKPSTANHNSEQQTSAQTQTQTTLIVKEVETSEKQQDAISESSLEAFAEDNATVDAQEKAIRVNGQMQKIVQPQPSKDLAEWQVQRRDELSDLIKRYFPDTIAPFFESKMLEANTHLSTPNDTKLTVDDQQWALDMEQLIKDRIMLHEDGSNLDVHSVQCMQKVCEILGTSMVPGSWHAVHWDIIKHVLEQEIALLTEEGTNLSFDVEGNEHFYFQFVFG
jgi:hypothetical protein